MSVLEAIQGAYPNLSKSKRTLSEFLLENWQEAAFWSAGTLARKVGVSESLVVRFAQDIGYSGYKEVQNELKELVRRKLPMASKLESSPTVHSSDHQTVSATIRNDVDNLSAILELTPPDTFIRVADAIAGAKKVLVVGMGNSSALARLFAGMLNLLTGEAYPLSMGAGELFARISRTTSDDLVVCIGFPRYMRATLQAAELTVERKTRLVAVTDSRLSPLARLANETIFVPNRGLSYAESQVATVAVANVLVNLVGRRAGEERRRALEQLEQVYDRYALIE